MNTIVFKQPPLVEIVAEARWELGVAAMPPQFAVMPIPAPNTSAHESHFLNFASKAGTKGYGLVERLVPPGFPLLTNQPAVRYRSNDTSAPIFQLGPGIFTANIVPPYKSWASFLPYLGIGLDLLLESRSSTDINFAFSELRLKYLDAFGQRLTEGKTVTDFLAQRLGIRVELPHAIMRFCSNKADVKPSISVAVPMNGGTIELKVGEGWVRNVPNLIMETAVLCKGPYQPNREVILKALNDAHAIIHDSFVEMTTSLHHLMEPESLS